MCHRCASMDVLMHYCRVVVLQWHWLSGQWRRTSHCHRRLIEGTNADVDISNAKL